MHDVAERYMAGRNFGVQPPEKFYPLDKERARGIAQEYDKLPLYDPKALAAYDAMIRETLAQYQAIRQGGLKVTPVGAENYPYGSNPRAVAQDVGDRGHMAFFKTEPEAGAFGTGGEANIAQGHPLLRPSGEYVGDYPMLNNDLFRVVHDYFGHIKHGYGFRAAGEDNAWRAHAGMYSPEARPAMTSETRGQNSWVNYGPHGDFNRTASGADTIYSPQKVGLMPAWTMDDLKKYGVAGATMGGVAALTPDQAQAGGVPLKPAVPSGIGAYHSSPYDFERFDLSKIGTGEGAQVYGHGIYAAENPAVSGQGGQYWKQFLNRVPYEERLAADRLATENFDRKAAIAALREQMTDLRRYAPGPETLASMKAQLDLLESGKPIGPRTYEVNIRARPEQFLDWDRPIGQQPAAAELFGRTASAYNPATETGESFYRTLKFGGRDFPGYGSAEKASASLREAGIPGIRYLDQGSRAHDPGVIAALQRSVAMREAGFGSYNNAADRAALQADKARLQSMLDPTHNYVVFDPARIDILRKYGMAGATMGGLAALAPDEAQAQEVPPAGGWQMGALAQPYRGDYEGWRRPATEPEGPPRPPPVLPDAGGAQLRAIGNTMQRLAPHLIEGFHRSFRVPSELAAENPYPPGSEEWQHLENVKPDRGATFAADWALNLLGLNRLGGGVKGGLGVGGSKIVQPQPKMGDVADLAAGPVPGSQAWRDAPNPNAPFPQYAEAYPPVGPPKPTLKEKPTFPGETYDAKQYTPEAKAFLKERAKIIKDMDENGYTRYFDTEKRFDVDPANYPLNVDTTHIMPVTLNKIAEHLNKVGAQETRARLQDAYAKGVELGGPGPRLSTQDWYMMGQLEADLVRQMGAKAGREAFKEKFATSMAATTGGMDPRSNLIAAGYQNYVASRGERMPLEANQWPVPVGARYGEQLAKTANKIADEGGFQALGADNPKRHNFAGNFMGHTKPGTMDEQMTMLMQNKGVPDWYGVNERIAAQEAAKAGVDPRKFQETGWHGFKGSPGTPMIEEANHTIERIHRLTGMPRSEIVRRGWGTGDIPIYSIPALMGTGAIGMGALASQDRYAQ